jgi:hypothetical protein
VSTPASSCAAWWTRPRSRCDNSPRKRGHSAFFYHFSERPPYGRFFVHPWLLTYRLPAATTSVSEQVGGDCFQEQVCLPQRCIKPLSRGRCRKRYSCSRRVRRAHHSKQRITSPERCARRTLHCFLQHPPTEKGCFLSSPGVNSRITGRQHATRDIQSRFCVHAEILCNTKGLACRFQMR